MRAILKRVNQKIINKQTLPLSLLLTFHLLFLCYVVYAEESFLPAPEEVERILIHSQKDDEQQFYTTESLLEALPNLRETNIKSLGFGKVWSWQKGTILKKNGKEIHWRAFTKNIILFETDEGGVFYTDILNQTTDTGNNKITRVIQTSKGLKEIVLEFED